MEKERLCKIKLVLTLLLGLAVLLALNDGGGNRRIEHRAN